MADENNNLDINIGINPAGAEAGARRTTAAVGSVVNQSKEMDAAFRRLKSAIDPAFAAQERYNKAIAEYDKQLKVGKLSQQEYATAVGMVKTAFDAQLASIERNSAAAKRAAQDKAVAALQEAQTRERSAADSKRIADEWLALERRNTQALKQEAITRATAEKAAIMEAVQAAKAAAAERAAASRTGGATVTKTQEAQMIREAAAAAKQAAQERIAMEHQVGAAIVAEYQQTYAAAKQLAQEATTEAVNAARQRQVQEQHVAEAITATEKAERREAAQAAREAAAVAVAAAKSKAAAEKEAAAATRHQTQATEEAARAARREAEALQEVRASINPTFAAQMRYNEVMARATQLLMANKLQQGEWIQIQKQAKTQMDINVRSMGQMNNMNVQMGYQMQDVVASWASGISPLVILAQQGGQTAAALSTMGGTAGRVAAFFAGPWGAAILGAVMVLGFLWDANKKGEKATKEVMDAEDRRKMKVKELTEALKEYAKAQHQSNLETLEAKRLESVQSQRGRIEVVQDLRNAIDNMKKAQKALDDLEAAKASMDPEAYASSYSSLSLRLTSATTQVNKLHEAFRQASQSEMEAAATLAQARADKSALERKEVDEKTAAYKKFQDAYGAAGLDVAKQNQARIGYEKQLTAISEKYVKLKEAERKADRDAAKEEAMYFRSREDAIQRLGNALIKKGYSEKMENFGVGDKRVGSHPGMGRDAHGKYAIDVNIPGGGNEASNAIYKKQMDEEVRAAQAAGYRVLWNGKIYEPHGGGPTRNIPRKTGSASEQHTNHAHIEAPKSIVGKPAGTQLAGALENAQMQAIQDSHNAAIADLEFKKEMADQDLAIVLQLQDQKIASQQAFYGMESKEALDSMRERARIQQQYDRQTTEERRRGIEQRLALESMAIEREQGMKEAAAQRQNDLTDFLVQNGLITEEAALLRRAQMRDQDYQEEAAHQNRMYLLNVQSIRDKLLDSNLTTEQRNNLHRELERLEAEHLGRMQVLQNGYNRDVNQIQLQSMSLTLQRWKGVADTFTNSMGSAVQGLWTKTTTASQALINMADQLVFKFADMGIKIVNDWIMAQFRMLFVKKTTDTAMKASSAGVAATEQAITAATTAAAVTAQGIKTAASIGGAAAQTGAAATAGIGEITTNAAVAAAGAYKSTVVIPFIGPIAAPAAAALALAAVLGFGAMISAEGGMGEVPSNQLAMVHKKEMILPAWIAEPLRKSLAAPTSSGMIGGAAAAGQVARNTAFASSEANFYYQPNNSYQDMNLNELLRRDGRTLRKWFNNEVRNGSLKV